MRILHVAETLPGGPATYLNEVTKLQVERYQSVVVLGPRQQLDRITVPGVARVGFCRNGRDPVSLNNLFQALNRELRRNRYDIVHLHSTFAGFVGRLRQIEPAVVYCPHGWSFANRASVVKRSIYSAAERILSRNCDAIVTISRSEDRLAEIAGISKAKCALIPNGIADRAWTPLIPQKKLEILLFVGRFDHQKGFDVLLQSAKGLAERGIKLRVAGGAVVNNGPQERLPEHVEYLGWLSPMAVANEIDRADAVVMPSRWEGMPLVAIEASRAGRPVIATDIGGTNEVIVNRENGLLFEPNSSEALLDALDRLVEMDLATLGRNGRQRYQEYFTAERMFRQLDSLYRSILARSLA